MGQGLTLIMGTMFVLYSTLLPSFLASTRLFISFCIFPTLLMTSHSMVSRLHSWRQPEIVMRMVATNKRFLCDPLRKFSSHISNPRLLPK